MDQRLGFIDGFLNFHAGGCSGENNPCQERKKLEAAVSSYYAERYNDESIRVGDVLLQAAKSMNPAAFAEREATEAGAFDGRIWMHYSAKERLGFVEGYLNALMPQTSRSAKYPQNPEYYANAITRFYSASPSGSSSPDALDSPVKRPIADVLWSFRNGK